jgi:NIMA (never in mitosis gene a)-related kinase
MSLAKYKKVKYLGKGSYGAALLVCLKANPDRKFVIKEIVVGHLKPAERDAAKQEAEVLAQMTHSNITMYIESFVEGSKLYIVMEHADGGDLTAAVKRRAASGMKWPENEVMRIFVQICLALKHVHEHNILHRDLKSQNIFLTLKGIVKLGDFGIAKILDASEGQAQTQIGTPYYLSPEICESKPYGRKSDVWSLGIVLFELTALELPFQAQSLPALVIRICSADPDYAKIDKYSGDMSFWIKAMLNKKPEQRPEVQDMLNSDYFKMHMSKLLSHTIRMGCGGAEGDAVAGADLDGDLDADEADRNIEAERHRQQEAEREIERHSKAAMERIEREAKRKDEVEKLKRVK